MKQFPDDAPQEGSAAAWSQHVRIGNWQFSTWIGRRKHEGRVVPFTRNERGAAIYDRRTITIEASKDGRKITPVAPYERMAKDQRDLLDQAIAANVEHSREALKWRRLYEASTPSEQWVAAARQLVHVGAVQPTSGIYFLIMAGEVVYVGKSRNVAKRLAGHSHKEYDDVTMLALPAQGIDFWEGMYIRMFQPKLNIIGKTIISKDGWAGNGSGLHQDAQTCTTLHYKIGPTPEAQ